MRVFVTGGAGFVGTRLRARLEAAGHEARGEIEVDVTSPVALGAALADCAPDAIVHLAALSSVADSAADPLACLRVNFLGTRVLLGAVRKHSPGARVLLVGSGEQYGVAKPGDPPFREEHTLAPRSPYARSKAAAEWLGTLAAREGLDVVRVRAFGHTGAGQPPRFALPAFARQIAAMKNGAPARLRVGNLDSVRDFLDVEDVVDAYVALLDSATPASIYNVASGVGRPLRELVAMLCRMADVSPRIEVDPALHRPTDRAVGDASRLRRATGWQPRRPIEDTLSELLRSAR